jgi:hypothetical protein
MAVTSGPRGLPITATLCAQDGMTNRFYAEAYTVSGEEILRLLVDLTISLLLAEGRERIGRVSH